MRSSRVLFKFNLNVQPVEEEEEEEEEENKFICCNQHNLTETQV